MEPVIKVENLSFAYPRATILKNLTFHVTAGEFLAVAGPNGAGKTTLLNLLCALLKPKSGSIHIDNTPIESYSTTKLAQKLAVVRQEFVPVFDFTVTEMVAMARTPYLPAFGFETKADLFYRHIVKVRLARGGALYAWVYPFAGAVCGRPLIASGRFHLQRRRFQ